MTSSSSVERAVGLSTEACHSCGGAHLERVEEYEAFSRVTSDCKPWKTRGQLAICHGCGLAQAVVDKRWREEAETIYGAYTLYHTSGGVEQSVFDPHSGAAMTRSQKLAQKLAEGAGLPQTGRLLDVGCGNGAFLRGFGTVFPDWSLSGAERTHAARSVVEAIPQVDGFYAGDIDAVPGSFEVVSLIHVLEHVPSPVGFLKKVRGKLAPGGALCVQVPNCEVNEFMYLVADHCSHFSAEMLERVVSEAGFEVLVVANDWVPKELTIIARVANTGPAVPRPLNSSHVLATVRSQIARLSQIRTMAKTLAAEKGVGLFGTSIAATWLFGEMDEKVAFFVDEDPHRVGSTHLGVPVFSPAQVTRGSDVFIALPAHLAELLVSRLESLPIHWHLPGKSAS